MTMTTDRPFTDAEHTSATRMGYRAARDAAPFGEPIDDVDAFTDDVHPDPFTEALDAFPDVPASDISDAIYTGIGEYVREHVRQLANGLQD